MWAAWRGNPDVSELLLRKGANVSMTADGGVTALLISSENGNLPDTKMLIEAGADVEASACTGFTALHTAADHEHADVTRVLLEAGANPNSRTLDGETPLFAGAQIGSLNVVRELLRAKADPLLTKTTEGSLTGVALDVAAQNGHVDVVREFIQQCGIEGCGGASGGVDALALAALNRQVDVMVVLIDAGVVDTGAALCNAAGSGPETSVTLLLRQERTARSKRAYINSHDSFGQTPLLKSLQSFPPCSPRVVRMLIDAGADTTSRVAVTARTGEFVSNFTPLDLADGLLEVKVMDGIRMTEVELYRLQAMHRSLLRVAAARAVSWLWPRNAPVISHAAEDKRRTKTTSTALTAMTSILRRRANGRGVRLETLFRWVGDYDFWPR